MNGWQIVIGLELHVQLATRSKMFSGAPTAYGAAPNTQACAIDLGLPGVLPVINAEAVRLAALFGLACGADIARRTVFARKSYFYPDLPKGYQISQYEQPIVSGGRIVIRDAAGAEKTVRLTRAHLEEDAGKSLHEEFSGLTGVDLNRAGTPLLEIVTEPDLRSPAEAAACMRAIHELVRHLGISDGNMQEGSFRCDANVSVRRGDREPLGTRVEIKNLNSFRFVEQAVAHEASRQVGLLESGGSIALETRLYDPERDETRPLRSKEEANDYRYFPDPDLLPVAIDADWLAALRTALPELPDAMRARFMTAYGLGEQQSRELTATPALATYFESTAAMPGSDAQSAANWIVGELAAALHRDDRDIESCPVSPQQLGALIARVRDRTVSGSAAKEVFRALWESGGAVDAIIAAKELTQLSDSSAIESLVDAVLAANAGQVAEYRAGKDKVLGFLVGQVMKRSGGKADPAAVNRVLKERLAR
jgi:aspartyl-tRNA(Asn)/glutamyl-tRNA(Gln) amidotransferase subunit B